MLRSALPYFNPRAPCGARHRMVCALYSPVSFQSTRPVRGATHSSATSLFSAIFQSTRPVRGATYTSALPASTPKTFQSTRPVRGATGVVLHPRAQLLISIHAPRAGRDESSGLQTTIIS